MTQSPPDRAAGLWSAAFAKSIAIIGISDRENSPSLRVLHALERHGYGGSITLINPGRQTVAGRPCHPSLEAANTTVDHAVVFIPGSTFPGGLYETLGKRARSATILASGFAEVGGGGQEAQEAVATFGRETGTTILGPNCLSVVNSETGLVATPSIAVDAYGIREGPVSIATQSGGVGFELLSQLALRGLGIRLYINTGNEVDVTVSDALHLFANDPKTETIFLYAEGLRDPRCFAKAALEASEAGKRVVVVQTGRTDVGRAAVLSHTGAIANNQAVMASLFSRLGIPEVTSLGEAANTLHALAHRKVDAPEHSDRDVVVVSLSGGLGAVTADFLVEDGWSLPTIPDAVQHEIRETLSFASPNNPIDITGHATFSSDKLKQFFDAIFREPIANAYVVVFGYTSLSPSVRDVVWPALAGAVTNHPVTVAAIGHVASEERSALWERGLAVFDDVADAASYLRSATHVGAMNSAAPGPLVTADFIEDARHDAWPPVRQLTEWDAIQRFEEAGVEFVAYQLVDELCSFTARECGLNFPIVVKLLRPGVTHKRDAGLLWLPVESSDELDRLLSGEVAAIARTDDRLMLQEYIAERRVEAILGIMKDSAFGYHYVLGRGGSMVEEGGGEVIVPRPVTASDAALAATILTSDFKVQGVIAAGILQTAAAFEAILNDERATVLSAELNPLLIDPASGQIIAIDAVIEVVDQIRGDIP